MSQVNATVISWYKVKQNGDRQFQIWSDTTDPRHPLADIKEAVISI